MCAYRSLRERVTKLWSITWHMESRSFSFHPGQMNALLLNLSQTGRYSIYVPQKEEKLSWYWCWLHIYSVHVDGLPVHTVTHGLSSNHLIAARLEVVPMTSRSDTLSLLYQATTCPRSYFCLIHHDAFVYPSQHGNADTVVRAMSVKCNKWWLRGRGGGSCNSEINRWKLVCGIFDARIRRRRRLRRCGNAERRKTANDWNMLRRKRRKTAASRN